MSNAGKDNAATIVAIGLLAYASADIAHHALGHGTACLALGGRIISLSSIFVNCSLHGATIDLAGPLANLVLGLVALLCARVATRSSPAVRLFCILAAAFNLFWFSLQLAFSAATRTDDWAWAMHQLQVVEPIRYGLIALGALAYLWTLRIIATQIAPFAQPLTRARTIVLTAWLTAGVFACLTAAFDHNAFTAVLRKAPQQSFLLAIGLLVVPAKAAKLSSSSEPATSVAFSLAWIGGAAIVGLASILLLGPGVPIAI